jgi:quinate dehydrogenase
MPWKVGIMPHLDDLTEQARQIGACNTIFIRAEGQKRDFVGTNTDCVGIREALLQNSLNGTSNNEPYRGRPAIIIGGGGTARAAIYTLRTWLACSKIYIINRDLKEVEAILKEDAGRTYDGFKAEIVHIDELAQVEELDPPAAIVSGIPDYPPKTAEEIKTREIVRAVLRKVSTGCENSEKKGVILEMCYHPHPWTQIADMAEKAGWRVILGTEAMIWQGLEQARLWTGRDIISEPGLVQQVKDVIAKKIDERTHKKP